MLTQHTCITRVYVCVLKCVFTKGWSFLVFWSYSLWFLEIYQTGVTCVQVCECVMCVCLCSVSSKLSKIKWEKLTSSQTIFTFSSRSNKHAFFPHFMSSPLSGDEEVCVWCFPQHSGILHPDSLCTKKKQALVLTCLLPFQGNKSTILISPLRLTLSPQLI